jgi:tetratricopeptide (TPR) repeat protein
MKGQSRQSVTRKRAAAESKPAPAAELPAGEKVASFVRPALVVFAVAVATRLVHVWQISKAPFFSTLMGDARGYDAWAQRIAGGQWWGGDVFYQAPLYPYFLGTLYAIVGRDLFVVRIVQALIGAAACTLLAAAAARLFGRPVGLVAGLALALYAPAIFFDGLIQKSVLDVFFVCLVLWLMSRIIDSTDRVARRSSRDVQTSEGGWWIGLGLAMGGLALTRENAIVFVAVIVFWIVTGAPFFGASRRSSPGLQASEGGRRMRLAGTFLLGLAIVLVPVAIRNYSVGAGFYVTTSQLGPNFFIGNNPKSDGTYMSLRFGRGAPEYERQDATELAEQALGRTLTPAEVSSYWTDRALGYITSQPASWLRLVGRKFFLLWNADEMLDTESQETYAEWSWPLRAGSWIGHFGILVPLAVLGIWSSWPDRRRLWVFYAMIAAYAASVVMFYVFARYRFPLVPFLIMFAAIGVARFANSLAPSLLDRVNSQLFFNGAEAGDTQAPAAMPSRGWMDPRRGISVSTRRGWGPGAIEKKLAGLTIIVGIVAFTNWPALSKPLMQAITETNLAVAFYDDGQLDQAITHYQRALALRPDHAPAHNNLGAALRAQGRLDEAVASYERALAAQPDYADAHYNLANALLDANKPEQAAEHFRVALGAIPDSAGVRNNLGIALANEGRMEEAIAEFRAALQVEPDSAKTHRNLGKALSEMGRTKEGIEYLRRATQLDPSDRDAHYDLGSDLLQLNQFAEAAKEFEAALAIAPDWAAAHNNLGIALASMGRMNDAISRFQQALKLDPAFEDAKRNLQIAVSRK